MCESTPRIGRSAMVASVYTRCCCRQLMVGANGTNSACDRRRRTEKVSSRGRQAAIDWRNLDMPVLLPYLGVETVVNDDHSRKVLLEALRGNFEEVSVAEVEAANGVARHLVRSSLADRSYIG